MAARFKMYSFPCLFELSQRQKYVIVCNYFNAMFHANKMFLKKKNNSSGLLYNTTNGS